MGVCGLFVDGSGVWDESGCSVVEEDGAVSCEGEVVVVVGWVGEDCCGCVGEWVDGGGPGSCGDESYFGAGADGDDVEDGSLAGDDL